MFRIGILSLLIVFISSISLAQNAVKWTYSVEKVEALENTYQLQFHAHIKDNWHMYSQDLPSPDEGPLATIFGLDENENADYIGIVEEEKDKMHSEMDNAFNIMVNYYTGNVIFSQLIKLKNPYKTIITGFVSYMVCDDTMCLPPEDFDFNITIEP